MTTVTPTQDAIDTIVRSFLTGILPSSVECVLGQVNRVPEPAGADFVTFTWIDRLRLETNLDDSADVLFVGSIAGTTMTVTSLAFGTITVGAVVFGTGVAGGTLTTVTALGSASGSVGNYTVAPSQTAANGTLAAGFKDMIQHTEIVYQVDVYGPNAADNAQIITTAWRDAFAFDFFQTLDAEVAPLYADDPRQLPVVYGEEQYENRWLIEARLQANQTVSVPQQYADIVTVTPESVDVVYPP